ncbi:MAG TPA: carbohydrate binding domain-containing protein [Acidimicrobiales bacterium]|nr:carbohydrate binding domain-containing protein [Acidimicrobiales bacterium]
MSGVVAAAFLIACSLAVGTSLLRAPRASASAALPASPNLLNDPTFEQGNVGPWMFAPGENRAVYTPSSAPANTVDQTYLETNSGSSSAPNFYQDVDISPSPGQSYTTSILLRSPTSATITGTLVLWAVGGSSTEMGQTSFSVSSPTWTPWYTDLDIGRAGHTFLRVQVYINTLGANLDADGATLQDATLSDAGFAQGLGPWQVTPGQNRAIYQGQTPDGEYYLETNTGSASVGSLYQDVSGVPVVNHDYQLALYLRSPTGAAISATIVLWALGGTTNEDAQQAVTVQSGQWTRYVTDLDVADPGHTLFRVQIYLSTTGENLDVAGTSLEDTGVADGDFAESGSGPWSTSEASSQSENGSGGPSGSTWLEVTSDSADGSLFQDVPTNPVDGHPYTASVYLKSPATTAVTGTVVLWALDSSGSAQSAEVAQTDFNVGGSWTQVSTVLDVASGGYDDLRLQVYLTNSGTSVDVDAATLADSGLDPPLGPPDLPQGVGVYGYAPTGSQSFAQTVVSQGWSVLGETGGLGIQQSPYTAASAGSPSPDQQAAEAVAGAGRPITWMSFWTVSAPVSGDTWYDDGAVAGQYVAEYLDSISTRIKPDFVILDPEGYDNGQSNDYPSDAADWTNWIDGWVAGIKGTDSTLTPALYVWQYLYTAYDLASLNVPVFVSISPIVNSDGSANGPGAQDSSFVPGANVDGYQGLPASCPAQQDEQVVESWGGAYNILMFNDGGSDCGP